MIVNNADPTWLRHPLISECFCFFGTGGGTWIGPSLAITAAHTAPPVGTNWTDRYIYSKFDLALMASPKSRTTWAKISQEQPEVGEEVIVLSSGLSADGSFDKTGTIPLAPDAKQAIRAGIQRVSAVSSSYITLRTENEANACSCVVYDSGGGIFIKRNNEYFLVGVIKSSSNRYGPGGVGNRAYAVNLCTKAFRDQYIQHTGDINMDGNVNVSDFNIVASNFGKTVETMTSGDITGDGKVDVSDFNIIANRFGKDSTPLI